MEWFNKIIMSIYKNFEEISKIFIIRRLDSLKPENIQENILKWKNYFLKQFSFKIRMKLNISLKLMQSNYMVMSVYHDLPYLT